MQFDPNWEQWDKKRRGGVPSWFANKYWLTPEEREYIYAEHAEGKSHREFAKDMKRWHAQLQSTRRRWAGPTT